MSERQKVQIADEFVQCYWLAQQKQFFFCIGDRNLKIPPQCTMFYGAFDAAFHLAVLYAVSWRSGTKTPAVSEKVNGFQKVCLALAVLA